MPTAPLPLLALALAAALQTVPEAPLARTHTVVGELARIDLERRELSVRVPAERRDYVLPVGPATRFVGGGRELTLSDLRVGEPLVVVCRDEARGHLAALVKAGASRYAAPTPGARRP